MAGIAGSVSPVFRDEGYVANATYDFYHAIIHNNKLYFCQQDGTIGHEPQETSDEYWFLSLDGNFADSAMLGGETAEQWQGKITNILNGTTPAGNALKLNGLTAEEFVKGKLSFFQEGETILSWALNPNGEYKKMVAGNYRPEDAPDTVEGFVEILYTNDRKVVKFTEYINKRRIWSRSIFGNSWFNDWQLDKDGGNAYTVDGYHASELLKTLGINGAVGGGNVEGDTPNWQDAPDKKQTWYYYEGIDTEAYNLPIPYCTVVVNKLNYARASALAISWTTGEIWSNALWSTWQGWKKGAFADEVLPLTGGTVGDGIKDNPIWFRGNAEHVWTTYGLADGTIVGFIGINSEGKLQFDDTKVGRKDILHTGNSLKVQASNDAPTDTATMWYDTANKTWKRYVDGAWQV